MLVGGGGVEPDVRPQPHVSLKSVEMPGRAASAVACRCQLTSTWARMLTTTASLIRRRDISDRVRSVPGSELSLMSMPKRPTNSGIVLLVSASTLMIDSWAFRSGPLTSVKPSDAPTANSSFLLVST